MMVCKISALFLGQRTCLFSGNLIGCRAEVAPADVVGRRDAEPIVRVWFQPGNCHIKFRPETYGCEHYTQENGV